MTGRGPWTAACGAALLSVLLLPAAVTAQLPVPEKIVLILLDDLGYDDLAHDSPDLQTPVLDFLATRGMQFTNACANGVNCSPTRAAILSGQYPFRMNLRDIVPDWSKLGVPNDPGSGLDVRTLAEALSAGPQGYRTAYFGKWHTGEAEPHFLPSATGFTDSIRLLKDQYFAAPYLVNDALPALAVPPGAHLTRWLTDRGREFLIAHEAEKVFLFLAHKAPHGKLIAANRPPGWPTAECQAVLDQLETLHGVPAPGLPPYSPYPADLPVEQKVFRELMSDVDCQLGRIWLLLQDPAHPDLNDALVIVSSDNGGIAEVSAGGVLRGEKNQVYEGGIRVPLLILWPGAPAIAGAVNGSRILSFDLYPTLLELAGLAPQPGVDGESFAELFALPASTRARDGAVLWQARHETPDGHAGGPAPAYQHAVVDPDLWKLVHRAEWSPGGQAWELSTELFDLNSDQSEAVNLNVPPLPPPVAARLQALTAAYDGASDTLARIPYLVHVIKGNVTPPSPPGHWYGFGAGGGLVKLQRNDLFDFHDGDFTLLATIRPASIGGPGSQAVIARKKESWRLVLEPSGGGARIKLVLNYVRCVSATGCTAPGTLVLASSPLVQPAALTRVAFTIAGWRAGDLTAKLWVNGQLEDSRVPTTPGTAAQAVTATENRLLVGANTATDPAGNPILVNPFLGEVCDDFQFHAAALDAEQLARLFAASPCTD